MVLNFSKHVGQPHFPEEHYHADRHKEDSKLEAKPKQVVLV